MTTIDIVNVRNRSIAIYLINNYKWRINRGLHNFWYDTIVNEAKPVNVIATIMKREVLVEETYL